MTRRPLDTTKENEASRKGYCWHCGSKPNTIPCALATVYTPDEELDEIAKAGRLMCRNAK
jgi:hypothetical protein